MIHALMIFLRNVMFLVLCVVVAYIFMNRILYGPDDKKDSNPPR